MWREHMDTKEIAKLQQQFSDLKQWKLEQEAVEHSSSSDQNNNGDESSDSKEVQISNAFSLLSQED